jgi:hypothetical protein
MFAGKNPIVAAGLTVGVGFTDYITLHDLQRGDITNPVVEAYFLGATQARCSHLGVSIDQSALNQATESIRTALSELSGPVRTLTVREVPDPPLGANYTTTGTYPSSQRNGRTGFRECRTAIPDHRRSTAGSPEQRAMERPVRASAARLGPRLVQLKPCQGSALGQFHRGQRVDPDHSDPPRRQ